MKRTVSKTARLAIALLATGALSVALAQITRTPAPANAKVYIISPKGGATVSGPGSVKFGLEGMGVAPAGIAFDNSGHHHLLIDLEELPPLNAPIPTDNQHVHFGMGQTQTTIELPPGKHTLQLLLGDHMHVPHNPVITSDKIT